VTRPILACDIETYAGFFLVGFKRRDDGKVLQFELSDRSTIDLERLRRIMLQHRIITYNGQGYDVPLIYYAIDGANNAQLKKASDRIIQGNVRYWDVERLLGIEVPRALDHVDLIEPQPNAFCSLKTLNGRLHGKKMQDLPIEPDARLSHADMDALASYNVNDLDATLLGYKNLLDRLELRESLGKQFGANFLSKSDAQVGEAIIRKEVEKVTKQKVQRVDTPAGTAFPYRPPQWLRFEHPQLQEVLRRLETTEFIVQHNGKVDLPKWLGSVRIGDMEYAMGIGGLHSTEKERAIVADDSRSLLDHDVASYYPAIIIGSGLYPRSLGRPFLDVYRRIRDQRVAAKHAGNVIMSEGLKIALNGCFGKLGSPYSILYAPHLMIAVTLTGQLALLMLIERAEAAGIPVVSANTDGVVFHPPRSMEPVLTEITKEWERETGFELESTRYTALYSQSVNSYIAVKEDGKVKRKGPLANPRSEDPPDLRTQMMTNPSMNVCSDAVVDYLTRGIPIEQTIRSRTDIRDFVTVVNVQGGGTWRGEYLGKVVRYVWARDGEPILYKKPHPVTGNHKKVPKSDGCRPVMELPDTLPADLDYDRYIAEAEEILRNVGAVRRPPPPVRVRVWAARRWEWLAASIAA
jgi:hypothetical protein